MTDEIEQVGGILAVVNGEGTIETDLQRVFAQQSGPDGVESAGPRERIAHRRHAWPHDVGRHALDPARHLGGCAARERQQQDPAGIDAVDDEVPDPMGQRIGLARAGAGDDQQRAGVDEFRPAVFDGAALVRVELGQIGGGHLRLEETNQL